MFATKPRQAFTLIEVLVFIAILGVLVGLLLPAITRVQEAAQQTQCRNNLKQMGIALQGYHHSHKSLPPGYIYTGPEDQSGTKGTDTRPGWGWGTLLLPHLEQVALYQKFDLTKPIQIGEDHRKYIKQPLPVYTCPSDQRTGVFWVVDETVQGEEGGGGLRIAECATNSYAANYGPNDHIGENPTNMDGLFSQNSAHNFRDIKDGLSQTMAIGERGAVFAQAPWAGAVSRGIIQNGVYDGSIDTTEHYWFEEAPVQVMAGFNKKKCQVLNSPKSNAYCFYSPHPGVCNFVFADGAVHAISFNTSYPVLRALCSRDGKNLATDPDILLGADDY